MRKEALHEKIGSVCLHSKMFDVSIHIYFSFYYRNSEVINIFVGVQICKKGSKSTSGYSPGGPYLLADLDWGRGAQVCRGSKCTGGPSVQGVQVYRGSKCTGVQVYRGSKCTGGPSAQGVQVRRGSKSAVTLGRVGTFTQCEFEVPGHQGKNTE